MSLTKYLRLRSLGAVNSRNPGRLVSLGAGSRQYDLACWADQT